MGPESHSNSPPGRPDPAPANGGCDVLIAGAGIIGLSIALELHRRGAAVTVLDSGRALQQASTAAAGMLAVKDPHNPRALRPLSELSAALYPAFLHHIQSLSGLPVPFQTNVTIQYLRDGSNLCLAEHSLDPRQLAAALAAAVRASGIDLREHAGLERTERAPREGISAHISTGERLTATHLVLATGASSAAPRLSELGVAITASIAPRKGQMLRVTLPPALRDLHEVHRSEHVYVVPRLSGPQAGTALIGATVEDAGFDTTTSPADLARLRAHAAALLPALGDPAAAPQIEAWAGLRPATADHLPSIGRVGDTAAFLATGHFRNGILLAPGTAAVVADLLQGKSVSLDLSPFSPDRAFPSPR